LIHSASSGAGLDGELAAVISRAAASLGVPLEAHQTSRLVDYLRLMEHWNATYNLTAVRSIREMATQHIVDSLSAIPSLRTHLPADVPRILDVGSGAGLPGVVFAILESQALVHCVDSVGKKVAFLKHVAMTLGLPNLSAVHSRVEAMRAPPTYGLIVSRAFAPLAAFIASTEHLLHPTGWWMAMKGKLHHHELAALPPEIDIQVEPLQVPGLHADRCLILGHRKTRERAPT
jgi:16S rRNA (guanine527-N7)-methyltransferase